MGRSTVEGKLGGGGGLARYHRYSATRSKNETDTVQMVAFDEVFPKGTVFIFASAQQSWKEALPTEPEKLDRPLIPPLNDVFSIRIYPDPEHNEAIEFITNQSNSKGSLFYRWRDHKLNVTFAPDGSIRVTLPDTQTLPWYNGSRSYWYVEFTYWVVE